MPAPGVSILVAVRLETLVVLVLRHLGAALLLDGTHVCSP
jgi:hypothetical protein